MAPILIFGYGNPSRGDDALGPELIQRLEHRQRDLCRRELAAIRAGGGATSTPVAMTDCPHHADPEKPLLDRLDLLTDFQLQPEHALDLAGRARVILVDADATLDVPYRLDPITPDRDASYTTHAMSPGALLWVYGMISPAAPPPCFLLRIRGYHFALGAPLTAAARENLDQAEAFLIAALAPPYLISGDEPCDAGLSLYPSSP